MSPIGATLLQDAGNKSGKSRATRVGMCPKASSDPAKRLKPRRVSRAASAVWPCCRWDCGRETGPNRGTVDRRRWHKSYPGLARGVPGLEGTGRGIGWIGARAPRSS
jgi:hypothetical protein